MSMYGKLIRLAAMFGDVMIPNTYTPSERVITTLGKKAIIKEFNLIVDKKSALSRKQRDMVKAYVHRMIQEGDIVQDEQSGYVSEIIVIKRKEL